MFIEENIFENVVRKFAAILFRPQCVNQIKLWKDHDFTVTSMGERYNHYNPDFSLVMINWPILVSESWVTDLVR